MYVFKAFACKRSTLSKITLLFPLSALGYRVYSFREMAGSSEFYIDTFASKRLTYKKIICRLYYVFLKCYGEILSKLTKLPY